MTTTLFAFFSGGIGPVEIIILLVLGVLLFGRKLPEVGRYLGKGIVEFKKGVKGIEDDVETSSPASQDYKVEQPRPPQRIGTTAPKFEENPSSENVTSTPPQV